VKDQKKYIRLMIPEPFTKMTDMALSRDYKQCDWVDHQTVILGNVKVTKALPEGFTYATGLEVSPKKVATARSLAFGYDADKALVEKSITSIELMRTMPDYDSYTDMYILSPDGDVAAFACLWFDPINKLGLLEPLGTVPKYRRMGLASIVLHEANRRVIEKGAVKCYGGDQKFYYDIGYESEVVWVPFEKVYD
jgi:GNAT superfamily N-acetyltransferase